MTEKTICEINFFDESDNSFRNNGTFTKKDNKEVIDKKS